MVINPNYFSQEEGVSITANSLHPGVIDTKILRSEGFRGK